MKKKSTLWIIISLVIVVGLIYFVSRSPQTENNQVEVQESFQEIVEVVYTDEIGENNLIATFNNVDGTVEFMLDELGTLTLPVAISASGVRYANEDESLVFWEHQGEGTVYKDGEIIYVGTVVSTNVIETNNEPEVMINEDHPLLGAWNWIEVVADGETIAPEADEFTINFDADGRVYGTTDCNNYFGGYTIEENSLNFGPLASTMMYCEGSQESLFTGLLEEAMGYDFDGDALEINLNNGSLLRFNR